MIYQQLIEQLLSFSDRDLSRTAQVLVAGHALVINRIDPGNAVGAPLLDTRVAWIETATGTE